MSSYTLHHGDCMEILPTIPSQSIDAVIADPPYGKTAYRWDSVVALAPMWAELTRVIKPRGIVVLFSMQPFTSALVMSNAPMFRHEWIWDKLSATGPANSLIAPKRSHENILVFADPGHTYNPIMWDAGKPNPKRGSARRQYAPGKGQNYKDDYSHKENANLRYPLSVIRLPFQIGECNNTKRVHPTQKPIDLLRYLVRTYTNHGDSILDFTMGSGSTGVASIMEGRKFTGIEIETRYFDLASGRIEQTQPALMPAEEAAQ